MVSLREEAIVRDVFASSGIPRAKSCNALRFQSAKYPPWNDTTLSVFTLRIGTKCFSFLEISVQYVEQMSLQLADTFM